MTSNYSSNNSIPVTMDPQSRVRSTVITPSSGLFGFMGPKVHQDDSCPESELYQNNLSNAKFHQFMRFGPSSFRQRTISQITPKSSKSKTITP